MFPFFNQTHGCAICIAVCPWSRPGIGLALAEQAFASSDWTAARWHGTWAPIRPYPNPECRPLILVGEIVLNFCAREVHDGNREQLAWHHCE